MATILEKVDNPADAIAPCRVCIEDLHGLSAVQEYFNVELRKGIRARFGKRERRKIIADVCHMNFLIYSTTLMVCLAVIRSCQTGLASPAEKKKWIHCVTDE